MNHSLSDSHPQRPQRVSRWCSRLLAALTSGLLFLPPWPTVNAEAPDSGPLPRLLLPTNESNGSSAATAFARRDPRSTRPLILNPAVVGSPSPWLQPGGQFRLDLLEHQDVTVAIDAVDATVTGGQIIRGRATSDEASSVTLTLEGKSLTGFVRLSGLGAFRVAPQGTGETLEVSRVEARAHALCSTLPQPLPARTGVARHAEDLPPADALAEPTVVDVMFLYTPQTVSAEGSEEGIRRRILDSVEETNYRLTNSLINVRIHPVYIGLYNTFETGDLPRDTYRLSSGTDGMERVPQLRNDYKADLVCLLTEWENQGIGGMAWDLTPPQGNPATGFAVIRRPLVAKGFMVLAHELGHLLGCAHDREHAGFPLDGEFATARKPYMFGHRFEVEGITYIDTMSYEPGIYVPYYGNPRLSLDGVPLGKPAESERPSDGARTINETAPYVARYRTALSRIEFAASRVVAAEESGSAIIRLVRTGDLNTSTRVNLLFDPTSMAKITLDYNWPTSTQVEFGTNQATADVVIPVLTDALVEGEESVRISLRSVLGDHGIARTHVRIGDSGCQHADRLFPS